jgi:hypothetical protein
MEALLVTVLAVLTEQWIWDVEVFSNPWMYYLLLIPVMFYVPFFFMKWMVLTTPFWLPIFIVITAIRRR